MYPVTNTVNPLINVTGVQCVGSAIRPLVVNTGFAFQYQLPPMGSLHLGRERNILFNDALNTFYLRLYGVIHMVKYHSDSEKGNLLSPHRLLLLINSKGSFICTIPQTG